MTNAPNAEQPRGLTTAEARQRLEHEGLNELPSASRRGWVRILLEIVKEPMFLLLLACGTLYLILGDREEALMLLGFVGVVIGITYYQEKRTENALEALRDLSSPRALVRRDGEWIRIAGRDVARGDVMMLSEGDRVPADAMLLHFTNLHVYESLDRRVRPRSQGRVGWQVRNGASRRRGPSDCLFWHPRRLRTGRR